MVTYVALCAFTQQGISGVQESPDRIEAFKELAKKYQVDVKSVFWTQGRWDMVVVAEAPDELTASALTLSMGALGNVRTETLRAFTPDEMKLIVSKMSADGDAGTA